MRAWFPNKECDVSTVCAPHRDDVNMMIVLKAMGCESDQEVVALVGQEEGFATLLMPSIQAAKNLGVFTTQQALKFLGERLLALVINT